MAENDKDYQPLLNAIEEDHVTNAERIQLEEIKQELIKDTKQEIEHVRELCMSNHW